MGGNVALHFAWIGKTPALAGPHFHATKLKSLRLWGGVVMFRGLKETLLGEGLGKSRPQRPAFSGPAFAPREPQLLGTVGNSVADDMVRDFQVSRNTHVIGLIHRHQHVRETFEQWFFDAMIGNHHLQDFMAAMAQVPPDAKLDIILHAIGGFDLAVRQIARAIKAHPGETTIFVPHHAHQRATLIALAGDRIVMGSSATLSFFEPSDEMLQKVVRDKGVNQTQDLTIMRQTFARNSTRELRAFVQEILAGKAPSRTVNELISSKRVPWQPLTASDAKSMGLNVTTALPPELYSLLQVCRSAPVRDKGVHVAERKIDATRARMLLANDFETCLGHGATMAKAEAATSCGCGAPQTLAHDDEEDDVDDDPHGVALESCDITLRPFIAAMEQARGSRVICVIHQAGMESDSVDTITAEDVMAALQSTPPDKPLDIILHTPGGYAYEAHQIALAIKAHRGRKTVFVPHFAMSGGTVIALAADEIVLAPHAVLGPIDVQVYVHHLQRTMPGRAIIDLCATKRRRLIDDELVALGSMCTIGMQQDHKAALALMKGTYPAATAERIARTLSDGSLTHGFPVTQSFARKLGLNARGDIPPEAVAIVRAYRRNRWGKRSVVFCG